MIKLVLVEEGKREELTVGTLEEIVDYLQENEELTTWVLDEDATMELPELDKVETVRDLEYELKKIDLSWWTLTVEEMYQLENGSSFDWETIVNYMDDDLREEIHRELAPCKEEDFLSEYCKKHKERFNEQFIIN